MTRELSKEELDAKEFKNEEGKRVFLCNWPGCAVVVPLEAWCCPPHWFRLPEKIRPTLGCWTKAEHDRAIEWINQNIPPNMNPEPLTQEERAYRRGALQVVQFIIANMPKGDITQKGESLSGQVNDIREYLASWEKELLKGRDSQEAKYLGTYCDTIRRIIHNLPPVTHHMTW